MLDFAAPLIREVEIDGQDIDKDKVSFELKYKNIESVIFNYCILHLQSCQNLKKIVIRSMHGEIRSPKIPWYFAKFKRINN